MLEKMFSGESMNCLMFVGRLVDCNDDQTLRIQNGILVVRNEMIVERIDLTEDVNIENIVETVAGRHGVDKSKITYLTETQFILPGFIDTHIHASQFPNAGLALDLPLLDWLEKYTFPTEAKFSQAEVSKQVYERCVRSTLDSGTTTAVYFATVHRESSSMLANTCNKLGQRAFVGKVCMDRNSPHYYVEETQESLQETKLFVQEVEENGGELVKPVITPRFVPSCSRNLMRGLGKLARDKNLHVQTHLSESRNEVKWVLRIEPDCDTYAEVYEKSGLLGPRTILAHCVHLNDKELEILRSTESGVSHCPNSNFSLKSGVCNVRRLQRAGVKVGLGTDCSGGYSASMLDSMRKAVDASIIINFTSEKELDEDGGLKIGGQELSKPLNYAEVLHLATRGGAALLEMEDKLGSLDKGKFADFLMVDMQGQQNTRLFGHEDANDMVHKFVFLGDDRNIIQVVVNGETVKKPLPSIGDITVS